MHTAPSCISECHMPPLRVNAGATRPYVHRMYAESAHVRTISPFAHGQTRYRLHGSDAETSSHPSPGCDNVSHILPRASRRTTACSFLPPSAPIGLFFPNHPSYATPSTGNSQCRFQLIFETDICPSSKILLLRPQGKKTKQPIEPPAKQVLSCMKIYSLPYAYFVKVSKVRINSVIIL